MWLQRARYDNDPLVRFQIPEHGMTPHTPGKRVFLLFLFSPLVQDWHMTGPPQTTVDSFIILYIFIGLNRYSGPRGFSPSSHFHETNGPVKKTNTQINQIICQAVLSIMKRNEAG